MNNPTDNQFEKMYRTTLGAGMAKPDRTNTGTVSVLGGEMSFSLTGGIVPLLSLRPVPWRSLVHELLWFISGSTDIGYLKANKISIWDSWVDPVTARYENGKLVGGSIGTGAYGGQWRRLEDTRIIDAEDEPLYLQKGFDTQAAFMDAAGAGKYVVTRTIDQLANAIALLKRDPFSRRNLVCSFNPAQVDFCQLAPCHSFYQFYVNWANPDTALEAFMRTEAWAALDENVQNEIARRVTQYTNSIPGMRGRTDIDNILTSPYAEPVEALMNASGIKTKMVSMKLYCRSQDSAIGTVFNVAQYGVLLHMVAQVVGMHAGVFRWSAGDQHIYLDQLAGIDEVLNRAEAADADRDTRTMVPRIELNPEIKNIDDFTFDDIKIIDYAPIGETIVFPVAV